MNDQATKPVPFPTAAEAIACPARDRRTRLVGWQGGFLARVGPALVDQAGNRFGVRVFCSHYDREAERGKFHLRLVELQP